MAETVLLDLGLQCLCLVFRCGSFIFVTLTWRMRKPYEAILNGRFARSCLSPKDCGRSSLVCRAFCEGLSDDDLLWKRHLEDDYAQLEGPTGPNGVLASYRQAPAGTLAHCAMRHAVHGLHGPAIAESLRTGYPYTGYPSH